MKYLKVLCALAVLAVMPVTSHAQHFANLARDAHLRAGPSRDYPIVAELLAGTSVWVDGCINGYRWCDVTVGPERGWVYAGNIIYQYDGSRVPLLSYGAVIGIGIITFSVGDYWDNHYRARPWYPQRQNWIDRPRPVLRPDAGHVRPLPPRPPTRPDGVERPPHGSAPAGEQHPQHRPPQAEVQRPPAHQAPAGTQPPGQVQAPAKEQRSDRGQPVPKTKRPPQGESRGGGERPPWDELPGGNKK